MWIALGILGGLALLITALLLLRVRVILKSDERGQLQLRYRYLFKTFGEDPDPDDPIIKMLKKSAGITRFEKEQLQQQVGQEGLTDTVKESFAILRDLISQVVGLLKRCTATKLQLTVVCAGTDAAETAIRYGQISAAAYSFLSLLNSIMRVRKRGCKFDLRCDFTAKSGEFSYHAEISVALFRVLAAFFRVAWAEAKRAAQS